MPPGILVASPFKCTGYALCNLERERESKECTINSPFVGEREIGGEREGGDMRERKRYGSKR
jgi:hypothetical protein